MKTFFLFIIKILLFEIVWDGWLVGCCKDNKFWNKYSVVLLPMLLPFNYIAKEKASTL